MDEEMSIFDCSFNVDAENGVEQILTLNEFMIATGFENTDIKIPVMSEQMIDEMNDGNPFFTRFNS